MAVMPECSVPAGGVSSRFRPGRRARGGRKTRRSVRKVFRPNGRGCLPRGVMPWRPAGRGTSRGSRPGWGGSSRRRTCRPRAAGSARRPRRPAGPGGRGVVDGPVDPGHVGHAGPAEEPPAARGQRQVEQDGLVGDGRDQRAQVGEQLRRARVQDVVDADTAGHEVGGLPGKPGQLGGDHVAGERSGDGQVQDPPGQAGVLAEFGQDLADVTAVGAGRAEALGGRSPSTTHSGPSVASTRSLCACQCRAKAAQSSRIAVTPSAQRPNGPVRSPDTPAAGVRVTHDPIVAMISTGERRGAPTRSATPTGPASRPDVRPRASAACLPPEKWLTRDKRR